VRRLLAADLIGARGNGFHVSGMFEVLPNFSDLRVAQLHLFGHLAIG
jgi:hypothetical protein